MENNLFDKRTTDKLFYKGKYIFSEEINSELNIAICKDMTTAKRLVHACNSYEELKEHYFTPDAIRRIQEAAYEAGFNAGQGLKM